MTSLSSTPSSSPPSRQGGISAKTTWKRVLRRLPLLLLLLACGACAHWLLARPMRYEAGRVVATFDAADQSEAVEEIVYVEDAEDVEDDGEEEAEEPTVPLEDDEDMIVTGEVFEGEHTALEASADEETSPIRTVAQETYYPDAATYLIVGIDHTRGHWGRADTLVVAVFDEENHHAGLISIPRDLYVSIPGHGNARINATLRIARRLEKNPLEVLQEVVENVLSIELDHVIVGDLGTFENTIDALGGIDVDVACAIRDNFIDERTTSGRRALDVETGRQHMNGVIAAMYARSRHGRSDWNRSRRQHAILGAVRRRVAALGVTEWLPVVSDALDGGVITSMSRLEMLRLVRRVSRLDERRLHGLLIGSRQVEHHRTEEGRSVLLPNYDAIDEALAGLFDAPAPGIAPRARRCRPVDVALQHTRRP